MVTSCSPPMRLKTSFSPHAWGWSERDFERRIAQRVLPTRVGMVRSLPRCIPKLHRSPHTRGDGPMPKSNVAGAQSFSPHAWGWSGNACGLARRWRVLPTRVGMVRHPFLLLIQPQGSPHTRGDGPHGRLQCFLTGWFSPHAWGWSAQPFAFVSRYLVLPTRVGMVRSGARQATPSWGSPHTRGDGPRRVASDHAR